MTTPANTEKMTAEQFKEAQKTLGLNDADLAEALGLKRGVRTVRAYKYKEMPVSDRSAMMVRVLLSAHFTKMLDVGEAELSATLDRLHEEAEAITADKAGAV